MQLNELTHSMWGGAGLAAILAGVAAGWQRVRAFASYVSSALVLNRDVHGYGLTSSLIEHIRSNYKRVPSGSLYVTSLNLQVDDRPMSSVVPFELPLNIGIWKGPRGAFLVSADAGSNIKLKSIRWISDPQGLIQDALEAAEARKTRDADSATAGNYRVIPVMGSVGDVYKGFGEHHGGDRDSIAAKNISEDPPAAIDNGAWLDPNMRVDKSFMYEQHRYLRQSKTRDPMRGLFYPEHVLHMLDSLKQWYRRRDWYQERGIPWRTGVLMWGPGGTGKSSMARVAAQSLGLPLYQYYLNTMNDKDFVSAWGRMDTPCVVALEDFDTVFKGRQSVTVHQSLSFECVLNQISGISSLNGVLLMVTTNHIDHIDAALGRVDEHGRPTRPGRIDQIVYMGTTTESQRQQIADYTLRDLAPDAIAALVADNAETTAAQFQSLCINTALARLSGVPVEVVEETNVIPLRTGTENG